MCPHDPQQPHLEEGDCRDGQYHEDARYGDPLRRHKRRERECLIGQAQQYQRERRKADHGHGPEEADVRASLDFGHSGRFGGGEAELAEQIATLLQASADDEQVDERQGEHDPLEEPRFVNRSRFPQRMRRRNERRSLTEDLLRGDALRGRAHKERVGLLAQRVEPRRRRFEAERIPSCCPCKGVGPGCSQRVRRGGPPACRSCLPRVNRLLCRSAR